jgi:superoxide reductase
MIPSHYIEFIELTADGKRYKAYLSPNDIPQAEFVIPQAAAVRARIYCNLHGLWTSDNRD